MCDSPISQEEENVLVKMCVSPVSQEDDESVGVGPVSQEDDENISTYLRCLSWKLKNMAGDLLYCSTYDWLEDEVALSQYRKYMGDAINYNIGAFLCDRYLYGSMNLDKFCAEMIEEDLKEYLIDIPNLPSDMVTKYKLYKDNVGNVTSEDVNGGKMGDTASVSSDPIVIVNEAVPPKIHSDIETNGYWAL